MSEYIIPAVALVGLLAFVVVLVIPFGKYRDLPNAALVIFAGPALLALVAYSAGSIYGEGWGPVLRALFLYTVIVLPGCLFFVFVGLRKENLFNAYVANLERLGLLRRRRMDLVGAHSKKVGIETDDAFQTRITAYMERFRALYGSSDDQDTVIRRMLVRAGVTLYAEPGRVTSGPGRCSGWWRSRQGVCGLHARDSASGCVRDAADRAGLVYLFCHRLRLTMPGSRTPGPGHTPIRWALLAASLSSGPTSFRSTWSFGVSCSTTSGLMRTTQSPYVLSSVC